MIGVGLVLLFILGVALFGANASRKSFRRVLPGELRQWMNEGIIGEAEASRLREKYRLDQIAQESQNTLIKTIFGFGAVLIALGIIAFVAAHWEAIPKNGRLSLVVGIMLAAHGVGFWLWQRRSDSPLGHMLVILGTLIFGATIALVAQVFHLSGEFYEGVILWTLGATIMGYAAGSSPHLILAVIASFVGYMGWMGDHSQVFPVYFFAAPMVFLPFAYMKRARGVHFTLWLFWGISLIAYLTQWENSDGPFWYLLIIELLVLMFWSYGRWYRFCSEEFANDLRILSILGQGILVYILSFHEVVQDVVAQSLPVLGDWRMFLASALGIIALISWTLMIRQSNKEERVFGLIFLGISFAMMSLPWLRGPWDVVFGTVMTNLLTVIFGGLLFWKGLSMLDRRYFWIGLALLVLEVVGRFFEYEAGLLWKSAAFVFAGLILIAGGVLFEQRRAGRNGHEA